MNWQLLDAEAPATKAPKAPYRCINCVQVLDLWAVKRRIRVYDKPASDHLNVLLLRKPSGEERRYARLKC
jgi:hypothetical protein